MSRSLKEKQRVLKVLNGLDVFEENGGEEAYMLVHYNEENRGVLNDVGITDETMLKYGDESSFCILSLAFIEGYCDIYDGNELIAFENSVSLERDNVDITIAKRYKGVESVVMMVIGYSSHGMNIIELSEEEFKDVKNVINSVEKGRTL